MIYTLNRMNLEIMGLFFYVKLLKKDRQDYWLCNDHEETQHRYQYEEILYQNLKNLHIK